MMVEVCGLRVVFDGFFLLFSENLQPVNDLAAPSSNGWPPTYHAGAACSPVALITALGLLVTGRALPKHAAVQLVLCSQNLCFGDDHALRHLCNRLMNIKSEIPLTVPQTVPISWGVSPRYGSRGSPTMFAFH